MFFTLPAEAQEDESFSEDEPFLSGGEEVELQYLVVGRSGYQLVSRVPILVPRVPK